MVSTKKFTYIILSTLMVVSCSEDYNKDTKEETSKEKELPCEIMTYNNKNELIKKISAKYDPSKCLVEEIELDIESNTSIKETNICIGTNVREKLIFKNDQIEGRIRYEYNSSNRLDGEYRVSCFDGECDIDERCMYTLTYSIEDTNEIIFTDFMCDGIYNKREIIYLTGGDITRRTILLSDDNINIQEEENNKITSATLYKYNNHLLVEEIEDIDGDGTDDWVFRYRYNSRNDLISRSYITIKGNEEDLEYEDKYEYEYDNDGRIVRKIKNPTSMTDYTSEVYKYTCI